MNCCANYTHACSGSKTTVLRSVCGNVAVICDTRHHVSPGMLDARESNPGTVEPTPKLTMGPGSLSLVSSRSRAANSASSTEVAGGGVQNHRV